jgi:hypothetical protein
MDASADAPSALALPPTARRFDLSRGCLEIVELPSAA